MDGSVEDDHSNEGFSTLVSHFRVGHKFAEAKQQVQGEERDHLIKCLHTCGEFRF